MKLVTFMVAMLLVFAGIYAYADHNCYASSVVCPVIEDAYVCSYGDVGVGNRSYISVGTDWRHGTPYPESSIIKVDLTPLNGTPPTNAILRMYGIPDCGSPTVCLYTVSVSSCAWDEGSISWSNQYPCQYNYGSPQCPLQSGIGQWWEWDVTGPVNYALNQGSSQITFKLVSMWEPPAGTCLAGSCPIGSASSATTHADNPFGCSWMFTSTESYSNHPYVAAEFSEGQSCVSLITPNSGDVLDNGCGYNMPVADGLDWYFDWSDCPGATSYHLYVAHVGSQYPAINYNLSTSHYHSLESGTYIINSNRFDWRWRVRAQVNGVWGDWTSERYFDVEPLNTDCSDFTNIDIGYIQGDPSSFQGQSVTVRGQVYIPSNHDIPPSGYIQDSLMCGINIYGSGADNELLDDVGNVVLVTGTINSVANNVQLIDISNVEFISSNPPLDATPLTTDDAASGELRGTYVFVVGAIISSEVVESGRNYVLDDGTGPIIVRVIDALGIPVFADGETIGARGAVEQIESSVFIHVGNEGDVLSSAVQVENTTWGKIKALYR